MTTADPWQHAAFEAFLDEARARAATFPDDEQAWHDALMAHQLAHLASKE